MPNNVKKLRISLGLSQKQLAEKLDTSQQQIQRIESGKQAAKLDLATAICAALEKPLDVVFPGAGKVYIAMNSEIKSSRFVSDVTLTKLRNIGIEADICKYTLKVLFRGHQKPMFFYIAANEIDRVFRAVQSEGDDASEVNFVVFDSDNYRIAINLRAAMFCHFLWDVDTGRVTVDVDDKEVSAEVEIYFAENREPMIIEAEAESPSDDDDEDSYLNNIFYSLDSGGLLAHERLHIIDVDGESVFLRAGDVTLLKVPLWLFDADERLDDDDGDD